MRPLRMGRAVGIGARLLGQRILPAAPTEQERRAAGAARVAQAERLGRRARAAGRGGAELGRSVWRPFARASGTLWYEVTGLFFALFALFFAQHAWSVHGDARLGPGHRAFVTYVLLAGLFTYFAVSSFLRARRRAVKR